METPGDWRRSSGSSVQLHQQQNPVKMSVKTYGDKPLSFQLEEGGDFYCIGSEVKLF